MGAYYNEFDPQAAAWLRELIKRGLIADGEVDERSILDVSPDDVRGFTQCHFFAGIGGWSYALRLAGWPDDRPVWTGSPPCQPFSAAGKQLGKSDERHLAPHFISLVGASRPPVLFGEQVASSAVFGKPTKPPKRGAARAPEWAWIDDLSDRLEAARYAVGASDIPAAGVGAPHIRQRTFFGALRLADAHDAGPQGHGREFGEQQHPQGRQNPVRYGSPLGGADGLADSSDDGRGEGRERVTQTGNDGPVGNGGLAAGRSSTCAPESVWRDPDWLFCRDGKWRPVEPGTQPLVDGLPRGMGRGGDDGGPFHPAEARVMRLRGYGNAIVPQVAAQFIRTFCEVAGEMR